MKQAIGAYRKVTVADKFREIERLRSRARHNEASALGHARREAYREADEKWQGVVAEKDTALAEKDTALAEKDTALAEKDTALAEKDTALSERDMALAEKEALIAELRAKLHEKG